MPDAYSYEYLNPGEFGAIFCELAPKKQKECMLELARPYAIQMLNGLPSDDAADFIGLLSYKTAIRMSWTSLRSMAFWLFR